MFLLHFVRFGFFGFGVFFSNRCFLFVGEFGLVTFTNVTLNSHFSLRLILFFFFFFIIYNIPVISFLIYLRKMKPQSLTDSLNVLSLPGQPCSRSRLTSEIQCQVQNHGALLKPLKSHVLIFDSLTLLCRCSVACQAQQRHVTQLCLPTSTSAAKPILSEIR